MYVCLVFLLFFTDCFLVGGSQNASVIETKFIAEALKVNKDVRHVKLKDPSSVERSFKGLPPVNIMHKKPKKDGEAVRHPNKVTPYGKIQSTELKDNVEDLEELPADKAQRFGKALAEIAVVFIMHEHWISLDISELTFPPMGASRFFHNLTFLLFRIRRKGKSLRMKIIRTANATHIRHSVVFASNLFHRPASQMVSRS